MAEQDNSKLVTAAVRAAVAEMISFVAARAREREPLLSRDVLPDEIDEDPLEILE